MWWRFTTSGAQPTDRSGMASTPSTGREIHVPALPKTRYACTCSSWPKTREIFLVAWACPDQSAIGHCTPSGSVDPNSARNCSGTPSNCARRWARCRSPGISSVYIQVHSAIHAAVPLCVNPYQQGKPLIGLDIDSNMPPSGPTEPRNPEIHPPFPYLRHPRDDKA